MTVEEASRKYHINVDKIKYYENKRDKSRQMQILRRQRFLLLDEIHKKQQSLDELDYMMGQLKKQGD